MDTKTLELELDKLSLEDLYSINDYLHELIENKKKENRLNDRNKILDILKPVFDRTSKVKIASYFYDYINKKHIIVWQDFNIDKLITELIDKENISQMKTIVEKYFSAEIKNKGSVLYKFENHGHYVDVYFTNSGLFELCNEINSVNYYINNVI
jgi:hypothetical protein